MYCVVRAEQSGPSGQESSASHIQLLTYSRRLNKQGRIDISPFRHSETACISTI